MTQLLSIENRRKKLRYRAHYRGFKEADLLVGGYVRDHIEQMDHAAMDALEAILANSDRDIYAWATGKKAVPAVLNSAVMAQLRAYKIPMSQ